MRAKEFIVERTGHTHPDHDAVHQGFSKQRDPGGYYPTYHQYRTGIAIGMADGSDNPIDVDHESWMGPYWTFHPYSDKEHDMIDQVRKTIPTDHYQVRPRTPSAEPSDTNKISPTPDWNPNKREVTKVKESATSGSSNTGGMSYSATNSTNGKKLSQVGSLFGGTYGESDGEVPKKKKSKTVRRQS
jgi:hypothetical protein